MQKELLQKIVDSFDMLMPQNQETILLLVALKYKIDNQIIDEAFTQHDFEETVDEVGDFLNRDQQIQKENISKKLSQYFYTTLKKGGDYRYQLTVFASELVGLVQNELEPQFDDIELIHTFERTLKLTEADLESIRKFEYWYTNHYQPAKRVILSHTENLQRLVDTKTMSLRQLLKNNLENTKELINSFIEIFEALGKQTDGLTQTLAFKQEVVDNMRKAEEYFSDKKQSWEKYIKIRNEIEKFFENIDFRVLSINDRIQASSSRLKTLYDTLRYKQLFKLKVEKYLVYLLKNSNYNKGEITLPENIRKPSIPYFREKLLAVPSLIFSDVIPREVPELFEDLEYKKLKEKENMRLLNRQESISKWLENINETVGKGKSVLFEDYFKEIYKQEQNLEVPIEVCFGLIQKYGNNKDANLIIEKDPFKAKDDLSLWKMKIQSSLS